MAGAHTLETPARVVTCAGWKRGPGASLASGLEELGDDVEAAIVVLADGPDLAPGAVERVIASWRAEGARSSRPRTAESAVTRCSSRGRRGTRSRTRAARARGAAVPCDDLGDPGDVNTPADLPERLRYP